jgi:hypothetical protein
MAMVIALRRVAFCRGAIDCLGLREWLELEPPYVLGVRCDRVSKGLFVGAIAVGLSHWAIKSKTRL